MGPPWICYDEMCEAVFALFVVRGLTETFTTAWRKHEEWASRDQPTASICMCGASSAPRGDYGKTGMRW
eukprot:5596258-Pyramimonas_sp.AAC.1